jgi:3-dehydroquinate synthase
MLELTVAVRPRPYPAIVGRNAARRLGRIVGALAPARVVVVSSHRVWSLHGPRFAAALRRWGGHDPVLIPDGERHKNRRTLDLVHDGFLERGLGRDGLVVAVGGGVVGDLAGFAAATYMRGVDYVHVPTTLLAVVDSSIGGKVGLNHPRAKNLIGAFHQPRAVVADLSVLDTLPQRELRGGAYEILKCGVLGDRALFEAMRAAPPGLVGWRGPSLARAAAAACRIKGRIVASDERESGLRRVLNLGHTLGHALEAATDYRRFTHGEAVGWGMIGATALAAGRGILSRPAQEAIVAAVDHLGPRPRMSDLDPEALLAAVSRDKKARRGRVPFILPTAIGRVIVSDVSEAEVRNAIAEMAARPR